MSRFNLSEWAVKHRALTLYFLIVSMIIGSIAFVKLGRAEDPSFTLKALVVSAQWPGATPEQVYDYVADPIERELQEIEYFDRVETTTRQGFTTLQVQFKDYTPPEKVDDLFYQVRKRMLDLQGSLPEGVQGPFVNDDFADVYFTLYSLTQGDLNYSDWVQTAETTRKALLKVEGVRKVDLIGEQTQEIRIEFNHERLQALNLNPQTVMQTIQSYQNISPSGFIETQGPRVFIRPGAEAMTLEQLQALPIRVGNDIVRLDDLAVLTQTFVEPSDYLIRNQGEDALLLGVVMNKSVNGLELSDRLTQFIEQWSPNLPEGVTLDKVTNQGDAIDLAVNAFQVKFMTAVLVVMLVSFIALGWRAGVVVALAIPLTLALTFFVMQLTGKNLDRITLGALILALGLLVDDAIIAIEMMLVKMQEGFDRFKAAAYAWSVTAAPMLFGTLVMVTGFVPIGFANSNVGEYAGNIFWILAIALLISWVVAVTFTPYLGFKMLPEVKAGQFHSHDELPNNVFSRALSGVVHACVKYRKTVVLITVGLFVLSVMGMAQKVEKQFFPSSDRPELLVDIYLPDGTSQPVTNELSQRIEAYLKEQPEVESLTAYVGGGAPRFFLALNPELPNSAFAKIVVVTQNEQAREQLRDRFQTFLDEGAFNEARVRVHALLFGPPVKWPVTFRVVGDDVNTLRQYAEQVRQIMAQNPHTYNTNLDWGQEVPVVRLDYDLMRLARLGLTPQSVAQQLQSHLQGQSVADVREAQRQIEITQLTAQANEDWLARLGELSITTDTGAQLPLADVAQLRLDFESPVLMHRNREMYINVNAEVSGAQPPDVTMAIWPELQSLIESMPNGYRVDIGGSVEESGRAEASIQKMMPVMVLLMITLVMLNMQSFSGTLMVLLTAPLGMIGAVAAMLAFSQPFGFVANLGLIGLAGILMRNTLILVGQIQENLKQGMDNERALIDATLRRARPVLLTAIAAVLAFIPLTTNVFWGPMAFVLIGGISVGTLLTLLFLPALYAVWNRV